MKNSAFRKLWTMIVALPLLFGSGAAFSMATQLGFALDGSGSVSFANFVIQRDGLAQAFNAIPTDSTVQVTVVQFASTARVEVAPTLIDSAATLANVIAQIQGIGKLGGGTNAAAALNLLTNQMVGAATGGDSLINLSTDGIISTGTTIAAANAAKAAGIDSVTAEAIGQFANTANLLRVVYGPTSNPDDGSAVLLPQNSATIPNPLGGGAAWVLPVSDFAAYGPAVQAKIQAIVVPPQPVSEPGSLAMLGLGLLGAGFAARRRRAA
jgi:hypothetical protein